MQIVRPPAANHGPKNPQSPRDQASDKKPRTAKDSAAAAALATAVVSPVADTGVTPPAEPVAPQTPSVVASNTNVPPRHHINKPVEPTPVPQSDNGDTSIGNVEETTDITAKSGVFCEAAWRKWLVMIGSPVAGLLLMVGLLSVFFSSHVPEPDQKATQINAVDNSNESTENEQNKVKETTTPPTASDALDVRWLPNDTRLVFSLTISDLAGQSGAERLTSVVGPCWTAAIGPICESLQLEINQIARVTLAASDTAALTNNVAAATCSLVAIQLDPDFDTAFFAETGHRGDQALYGSEYRYLDQSAWPHPFVILPESRTIVTGPAQLLQQLGDRSVPAFASRPISRLVETMRPTSNLIFLLDMDAAHKNQIMRKAARLLAVWPQGNRDWCEICDVPTGFGLNLCWTPGVQADIALVCQGKAVAEGLDAKLAAFWPTAKTAVADRINRLQDQINAGAVDRRWADRYEVFLQQLLATCRIARRDVVDDVAWIRTSTDNDPISTALVALEAVDQAKTDWLQAGLSLDKEKQEKILNGLDDYNRAQHSYPDGAVGGYLLPPETRLSWLAMLLPYQEHRDWHRRLEFGYPWNSEHNTPITSKTLHSAVNPTLGPAKTDDGFPVTHYVGVAGIGRDAGHLDRNDPKAGVFGFGRSVRPQDIPDGAANTIAILGVSDCLGPWAAGGHSTIRALTQRPYVNGPDGFGSGQPQGMLASMADGSTRFISKDIDPTVLEQMATVNDAARHKPLCIVLAKPIISSHDAPQTTSDQPVPPEIEAALATPLLRVNFVETPLREVVEFLTAMTTVEIEFDDEALSQLGHSRQTPINLELSHAQVGKILESAISPLGLICICRDGRLFITRR